MASEMEKFQDIEALRRETEEKRTTLQSDYAELEKEVSVSKERANQIQSETDSLKRELDENDAHIQIVNLEKKLQYVEQNNFALRDAVEARQAETNTAPVREQVMGMLGEYNSLLQAETARVPPRMGSG